MLKINRPRSTAIQLITYDDTTLTLSIVFRKSQKTYRWGPIPESEYEGIIKSPNPGTYWHLNIKGKYRSK